MPPVILGFLAVASFGLVAVIAEGKPSSSKRLHRSKNPSLSRRKGASSRQIENIN